MESNVAWVAVEKCNSVARLLQGYVIPADAEDAELPNLTPDEVANFYFLAVAICHQTQQLRGHIGGDRRRGWDYLWLKLLERVAQEKDLLDPSTWIRLDAGAVSQWFFDPADGHTIDDAVGRVEIIRELGRGMRRLDINRIAVLYERSGGSLAHGENPLLSQLSAFRPYNDPVEKKSLFFLGLMSNSGHWEYQDPHSLHAPADYHEIRGHLRIGTVQIDSAVREKIDARRILSSREDVAIRNAVRAAITAISSELSVTPMQLHYLFWNIFRNVCRRESPLCHSAFLSDVPQRYREFTRSPNCPFGSHCESAGTTGVLEHTFITDWY